MEERIMTRDETINILMSIQAAYPSFKVPDKTVAVNTWYSLLRDYEYSQVSAALKKYIQTNKSSFAPSIGQIIDEISDIYSENEENEMEAWILVQKAIRNSTYHADEEFAKLPEIVQKAVSHPRQLQEWAIMENIDGRAWNVMQSNFMRTYRAEVEKEKNMRKLSPDLLNLISQKNKEKIGYEQGRTETDAKTKGEKLLIPPYELGIKLYD
jgi:hypothetical protein